MISELELLPLQATYHRYVRGEISSLDRNVNTFKTRNLRFNFVVVVLKNCMHYVRKSHKFYSNLIRIGDDSVSTSVLST